MALLIFLSLSGIFGVLESKPTSSPCCLKKTVGGVPYTLVDEADTSSYNCLSNCVYERDNVPGGRRFCFQEGHFEVVCNEGPLTEGILIAGGFAYLGILKSTEVFLPGSGKTCPLADLPNQRVGSTLDNVNGTGVLCGGAYTLKSCLQFNQTTGNWSSYATTLLDKRVGHSSWVSPAGLVLMGGEDNRTSTEIVNGGMSFTLVQDTLYACSIQLGDYTILTGGRDTLTVVSKYNLQGHVEEDLPSLLDGRDGHACGSYRDGGDRIIVVAGGSYPGQGQGGGVYFLSTTEVYRIDNSNAWIYGQALPTAMLRLTSVSVDQGVIILGGYDGNARSEILLYKGGNWTNIGQLGTGRYGAAATAILVDPNLCD